MSIEAALADYWQRQPGIQDLIGTHMYPITAKQQAPLPYMTWQRTAWIPAYHMRGRSNLAQLSVQVDCFALQSAQVERLARALVAATDAHFYGQLGPYDVRHMAVVNDLDVPETPDDGGQVGVYHRALELVIWYRNLEK